MNQIDVSHQTFTIFLGSQAHEQAQARAQHHQGTAQIKQVYLNTLAIATVYVYLQCMGFEPDWQDSDSADLLLRVAINCADLYIPQIGRLECIPVMAEAKQPIVLPPESQGNRAGYVVVELEPTLRQAKLLGFVPSYQATVTVQNLQSLDQLMRHLHQLESAQMMSHADFTSNPILAHSSQSSPPTQLWQWFQGMFESSWRSLDELLPSPPPLATSLRRPHVKLRAHNPESRPAIQRAKILDLALQLEQHSVVLLVAIAPDVKEPETPETVGISVQLYPLEANAYVPPELHLLLQSESGDCLQEVRSRSYDRYIQLRYFRGTRGESFEIHVVLGEVKLVETFII